MFLVALLAGCPAQGQPQAQPGSYDRVVPIEITAEGPQIEGHGGSRQVEYVSEFAGILHAWTKAPDGLDTALRVDASNGRRYEDDDSGGKPTPYLGCRVGPGSKLVFTIFAAAPDGIGSVELHLCAAPETAATRAAVEHCKQEIAAIRQLRATGDLNAVQTRATALADYITDVPGGAVSNDLDEQVELAAFETDALGLLRPTDRFCRHNVAHCERMLPPDHLNSLKARLNLACKMRELGDPQGSRDLLQQILDACTRTLPEEHPVTQDTWMNLSNAYSECGDLRSARRLLEKLVAVCTRLLPEDDERLLKARTNLATALQESGDLSGALQIQEDVLAICSQTLADGDPSLQISRINLANNLALLGDLERARVLMERALDVYSHTLPEQAPALQTARLNLAATLVILGDLEAARALLESVLTAVATLPDDHVLVQPTRGNLAVVLRELGKLEDARTLQEQVLAAYQKSLPSDDISLLVATFNLAATRLDLEDVDGARLLLEEILEHVGSLSDSHYLRLAAQEGLAAVMASQGALASARAPLYEHVLDVRAKVLPDDHPDLQTARRNLLAHLARECSAHSTSAAPGAAPDEARLRRFTALAADLTRGLTRAAKLAILTASSREAEERCASQAKGLDDVLSFAAGYGVFPADPELERGAFLLGEVMRGAALASASVARRARGSERFPELQESLHAARTDIARLAQSGGELEAFRAAVARRDAAEQALVALAREQPDSGDAVGYLDLDAIRRQLAPREAVVSYRRYLRAAYAPGNVAVTKTDSMCAHVLRADGRLQRVELGAMAPIEQAVQTWRSLIGVPIERGEPVRSAADDAQRLQAAGAALRRLVFDPLLPAIDGADELVVLLDDVLHAVPIDALPFDAPATTPSDDPTRGTPQVLGERYAVLQRLSLRAPALAARTDADASTLLALGGAAFNSKPQAATAGEDAEPEAVSAAPAAVPFLRRGAWERRFEPLPNSGMEARGVAALAEEALGDAVVAVVLENRKASRDAVTQLAPRARWLHLATHGWCASESIAAWNSEKSAEGLAHLAPLGGERMVRGLSPMLLCGLAFAGANLPADDVGRYPGLITAEEIAGWDLANCELAVLSACETNVGDRRAGQGVASLQKALHLAGARTVITSLWRVHDEATKELMLDFYRRLWVLKRPKHQALWEAKLRMRDAKDDRGQPKYTAGDWAGWVLTGIPD